MRDWMKVSVATFLTAVGVYFGMKWISGEPIPNHGTWDLITLAAFILMMCWLLAGRRDRSDTEGHEHASDSLAFRFGKSLNRVRRGFRRSA